MSNRLARQMSELLPDSAVVVKTADATLTVAELFVEIDSSDNTVDITLPPVAEAKGLMFAIYVRTYSSAITLVAPLSEDYTAPTLNGVDDGVLVYSDGRRWWTLATRT